MSCTYTYKNKKYSKDRLLRKLATESLEKKNQDQSIQWLKDNLSMTDSEIIIIKGLIDNKSLGRFLQDGKILLSSFAETDVAYHEAFHRVFRLYSNNQERKDLVVQFKKRKGWESLLKSYKANYPELTEQELIEEYLADEFADYVTNEEYKLDQPTKSIFDRIINFLKSLLGLNKTDIKKLYRDIATGKFKNAKLSSQPYRKNANKILIQGYEMSVSEKNEIADEVTRQIISRIVNTSAKSLDDFVSGRSIINDFVLLKRVLQESILPILKNSNPDLARAVEKDYIFAFQTKPANSLIYNFYKDKLQRLGLSSSVAENTNDVQDIEDLSTDQNDMETPNTKGEFTSAIEVDPKSNLSKRLKIVLASFSEPSLKTDLGFPKPILWSQSFLKIAETLAGVPTEESLDVLRASNLSFKSQLLAFINKEDSASQNFRNDFISSLSKTINNFNIVEFKDGDFVFFNANNNTKVDKIIKIWQSDFIKTITEYGFNNWKSRVEDLNKNTRMTSKDVKDILGIDINEDVNYHNLIYRITDVIKRSGFSNTKQPDYSMLFSSLDIQGSIKDLATLQSEFEDATDLMVYAMGKKIYGLGLNTHVTNVINRIAYAQKQFTEKMSISEKLDILKQYVPYVVSDFNIRNKESKEPIITNPWLSEILEGKKLQVNIIYNFQNETGDQLEISDLDETDLHTLYLNGSLSGMTFSLKHSDRSIYYAYGFQGYTSPLVNPLPQNGYKTEDEVLNYLAEFMADQINTELDLAKKYKEEFIAFQYFGKNYDKPGIASIIGEERWKQLLNGDTLNKKDIKEIKDKLVDKYYKDYLSELNKWNVLENGIGKSKLSNYLGNKELAIATAFVNEVVAHISENRLFNNDMRFYKNPTDFFKRLAPTSSTGQALVNDSSTNERIRKETSSLREIIIYNPITKKEEVIAEYNLAPDGQMRGITLKENESYVSHLIGLATDSEGKPILSKITGKQESKIFMIYEYNLLADFPNEDKSKLEAKIRNYESKYKGLNENDGQSYMNIIAFKNYMIRLGQWTEGMENVFKAEMQIMKAKTIEDIYDIEIEIRGKMVKVFEIPEKQQFYERISKRTVGEGENQKEIPVFEQFHPLHTLKTQYSGFTQSEQYLKEVGKQFFDTSIFKTSQHVLTPSNIIGTNLALMNLTMIKNGIDIIHMGSANKVGGVDPKLAAQHYGKQEQFSNRKHIKTIEERGLEFYNERGEFNYEAIDENTDIISYLFDVNFMKDQVKIGNKVKDEIKGSTQSLKIILSNLIVNGKERFEGAKELLDEYKEIINRIVSLNVEELNEELQSDGRNFESKDQLKEALLTSQLGKGAPENILNAIENFIEDPIFERMSNKEKIENILYSIITNTAITFKRPGNAYPQTAVTGYEPAGKRIVSLENNNIVARSNQQYVNDLAEVNSVLKFYDATFDKDGKVTKIDPAEVIIPLPDYWIEPVLKKYKTRNIAKAINQLNKDIENGKVTNEVVFKALRIPNQQLSSNDIMKVKKFMLPTMQAYAIIPSEMVVKTGGDFDIDKLNIYWNEFKDDETLSKSELEKYNFYAETAKSVGEEPLTIDTWMGINGKKRFEAIDTDFLIKQSGLSNKDWIKQQSKKPLYSRLLELEKRILLHPNNGHHLFMPIVDDIIASTKTGVYGKIYVEVEGNPATDSVDLINSLMPHTQVKNGLIFVKGKFGVGIVALAITGHSTSQADSVSLNNFYYDALEDQTKDTMLRFEGLENNYSLDNYTDNENNIITEMLSQLLTTQVDNVKNPVGIKLGINNQTLNIVEYLNRRGVGPETIIAFIKQPLIQEYLVAQRINESILYKSNNLEKKKADLIKTILSKHYTEEQIKELSFPDTAFIKKGNLINGIKNKSFDINQLHYFAYFLELLNQSRALSDFSQEQTADTKAIKNKTGYEQVISLKEKSLKSEIVPVEKQTEVRNTGVISAFTKARESYKTKFNEMYITNHPSIKPKFDALKDVLVRLQKTKNKKERVGTTFENDFILYFAMKYVLPKIDSNYYNTLFGLQGQNSLVDRIKEAKENLPNNLVLNAFLPLLKTRIDEYTESYLNNLRLFEREINNADANDLINSMKEIAEIDYNLYRDLVVFSLMQSGFNNSPFNYLKVVPVGLNNEKGKREEYEFILNDIMNDAIKEINNSIAKNNIEFEIEQFFDEFQRNNPQYLRKNGWRGYPLNYTIGFKGGALQLFNYNPDNYKQKERAVILGSTYHKRYGVSYGGNAVKKIQSALSEDDQPVLTKGSKGIGEEISSYKDDLAYALTNPVFTSPTGFTWSRTWTPKQKEWRDYMSKGIVFEGKTYKDVEEAYQKNKSKYPIGQARDNFMLNLIEIKLRTYPKLIEEINKKGGINYLTNSTHQPTKQKSHWETGGNNAFIKLLSQAYLNVTGQQSQPVQQPKQLGLFNSSLIDKFIDWYTQSAPRSLNNQLNTNAIQRFESLYDLEDALINKISSNSKSIEQLTQEINTANDFERERLIINRRGILVQNEAFTIAYNQIQKIKKESDINANQLQTTEDKVETKVSAEHDSLFPQYEYFNKEQKEAMANVIANNETQIECKFTPGTSGKFGR